MLNNRRRLQPTLRYSWFVSKSLLDLSVLTDARRFSEFCVTGQEAQREAVIELDWPPVRSTTGRPLHAFLSLVYN